MSGLPSAPTPASESASLPLWARIADALSLVLIALTVLVTATGGFRIRLGVLRLGVTSPLRLLVAAGAIVLVRYLVVPRRPAFARLLPGLRRMLQTTPARTALVAVLGTRPAILFVGYFALAAFGYIHERPPVRFSSNEIINLQARWDASWYLTIATEGYRFDRRASGQQQNIVFFPAYPMAVRTVGRLLGGSVGAHLLAGTLVSWTAFFAALVYLFRLARDLIGSDEGARTAVLLVATYPFALFYGAIYTESLYLLGAIGAFYHARRREYLAAAVWGLVVGLTRPNGCFLALPLLLVAAGPWLPSWARERTLRAEDRIAHDRGTDDRDSHARQVSVTSALVAAAAPGVGVLLYSAFVWQTTGNPLAWAEGHAAWGREYAGLWTLVASWGRDLVKYGLLEVTAVVPIDVLNALGALFVLGLAVPVWRAFGLPYALMILVNLLPPLAAGGFLSAGRFSAVLFPAFVWLASRIPVAHRSAWLATFMAMQALNAALFYTWHELF